jgi:hypothetical protein
MCNASSLMSIPKMRVGGRPHWAAPLETVLLAGNQTGMNHGVPKRPRLIRKFSNENS